MFITVVIKYVINNGWLKKLKQRRTSKNNDGLFGEWFFFMMQQINEGDAT